MICEITDCDNYTEGGTKMCATHNSLARRARKESLKPKKKARPIKQRSEKRTQQNDMYVPLKNKWIVGKVCAVCEGENPELPPMPAEDNHHMAGKEGALLLDTRYWLPVCRRHHTFITEHSAWAIQNGYSVSRNKKLN